MTYKRVLTAADDALKFAAGARGNACKEVDKKFAEAIHLLGSFERDFPSKNPTADLTVDETVTREASGATRKMSYESSPLTILSALRENLHSNVTFPISFLPLNADKS